jgi:hypothetical protein
LPMSNVIAPRFVPAIAVENQVLPLTLVQRKSTNGTAAPTPSIGVIGTPTLPTVMRASAGQPLPNTVQRKMSDTFGAKFDHVRVHTDSQAAASAQQMGAEAYTVGSNIFFNSGRYQPDSPSGQALIAHELTHVVQQAHLPSLGNGRVLETSTHGQNLEREAIQNERLMLNHLTTSQKNENTRSAGETSLSIVNRIPSPPPTTTSKPISTPSFTPNEIVRMVQSGQLQTSGLPSSSTSDEGVVERTRQRSNAIVAADKEDSIKKLEGKKEDKTFSYGKDIKDDDIERVAAIVYRMLRSRLILDGERHGTRGRPQH